MVGRGDDIGGRRAWSSSKLALGDVRAEDRSAGGSAPEGTVHCDWKLQRAIHRLREVVLADDELRGDLFDSTD